jgi:hypothetical protein
MTLRTTSLLLTAWALAVAPAVGAAQDEVNESTTPEASHPTPDPSAESLEDGARVRALEARLTALESQLAERDAAESTEEAEPGATPGDDRLNASSAGELEAAAASAPETFTLGGYAELLYAFNFNEPSNGITHLRGFDNRHNSFTIANVALDAQWDAEDIVGRVTLQVGSTPATYYLAEPSLRGALGTNASDATLWQFVQQAYVGYRLPIGTGLLVSAGLYLSPIGPEGMAVRDNWNWSRSNLFFGLPFYHTGVRLSYALDDRWAITLAGYNGWNTVLDNNEEKSIALQLTYSDPDRFVFSFLYFTGVERGTGAPEGRAWRHLFDAHATLHATEWLSFLLHVNAGFEPNTFGTSSWFASAAYARVRLLAEPRLYVAARGDVFYEHAVTNAMGSAGAIFWPATTSADQFVSSATLTVEVQPVDRVSFRAEYRHDHAGSPIYFGGVVATDPVSNDFVMNRVSQDTVTLGATTWF